MIVFILNMWDVSHTIKLAPKIAMVAVFMEIKLEKWEIFNFADFHLKTHIPPFFFQTKATVTLIEVNICSSI